MLKSDPASTADELRRNGSEMSRCENSEHAHPEFEKDSYRGAVMVLFAAALLGSAWLGNPVLFDVAVTLALSAGTLIRVARMQAARLRAPAGDDRGSIPASLAEDGAPPEGPVSTESPASSSSSAVSRSSTGFAAYFAIGFTDATRARSRPVDVLGPIRRWFRSVSDKRLLGLASAGVAGIVIPLLIGLPTSKFGLLAATVPAAACLMEAGLAATAARYLAAVDPVRLPEAPGLTQGASVTAWILVLAAASMWAEWAGQTTILRILHLSILVVNAVLIFGLLTLQSAKGQLPRTLRLELGVLSILGSRANILASALDTAERQLGIDLRSTWAFTVDRHSLEPLVIGLCLLAWLSTSVTVVGLSEQGLVERLGVLVQGPPLMPGIHLHWPWPVDRVLRTPAMQVRALSIGHEGEERGGPEDVLWARQHAANEYTLLLGNGRDLITVDAAVQFRIADIRAWRFRCQNPADALRAIAYRAVMRCTVNRTLSEALSENVVTLTGRMRSMVQQDADALGLGVEVLAFTVGGMHPPVMVASDYQAVVSAELGKVTSVVQAQAYRNLTVPAAEASAQMIGNSARAEGAEALAQAAGLAWSFRALESQYHAAPQEFFFRRRLETLEKGLGLRGPFTVVDTRFQRDGGELWVMP